MQADANKIVGGVKDFGLQLCTDKPDLASVLKIFAFDSDFDLGAALGSVRKHPLNLRPDGRDLRSSGQHRSQYQIQTH